MILTWHLRMDGTPGLCKRVWNTFHWEHVMTKYVKQHSMAMGYIIASSWCLLLTGGDCTPAWPVKCIRFWMEKNIWHAWRNVLIYCNVYHRCIFISCSNTCTNICGSVMLSPKTNGMLHFAKDSSQFYLGFISWLLSPGGICSNALQTYV